MGQSEIAKITPQASLPFPPLESINPICPRVILAASSVILITSLGTTTVFPGIVMTSAGWVVTVGGLTISEMTVMASAGHDVFIVFAAGVGTPGAGLVTTLACILISSVMAAGASVSTHGIFSALVTTTFSVIVTFPGAGISTCWIITVGTGAFTPGAWTRLVITISLVTKTSWVVGIPTFWVM